MLLALASYSACSRSSSDKRMVKFFLGSINCPLRPISNPFFRFFFIIRHWRFPLGYSVSKTCAGRICQIRKTQCVLPTQKIAIFWLSRCSSNAYASIAFSSLLAQNLVRGSQIPLKPSAYMPHSGQLSVIPYVILASTCITTGITIK